MLTLHIINKAPDHPRFLACLEALAEDDTLVLMENAVMALVFKTLSLPSCYALQPDVSARALSEVSIPGVKTINYPDLVALTETHQRIVNW
ncbi:MAG: sulfurtransferase complex subunit TusB [Marinobacter sp.]|uniref:sulfurtransferase complex subunit TusB n=1 Tax=Marinobacter sp. TaxID=50741 RepID=UPI00349FDD62